MSHKLKRCFVGFRQRKALAYVLVLFFALLAGCGKRSYKDTAFFMGTFVGVTSVDPKAKAIVFGEFQRVEKMCSLFDKDSELSRLNETGDSVVSAELFALLKKAKMFYEMTDYAFDVTVAPEALLWKKAFRVKKMPDEQEVKEKLLLVGFDNVYLDEANLRVKLLKAGMEVDLGGMAKGYAVDCSIAKFKAAGIESAIVNAGGDLFCLGENRSHAWQVGIRDPRQNKSILETIDIINKAVATSGDYEQFFVFQNKRYSHIINPKTGYPAESDVVSATVIAQDTLTADVLATAFIVLGVKKSSQVIKRFRQVKAKLVTEKGNILNLSLG